MKGRLSLVELAVYGYDPARVQKGSWLERQFGPSDRKVEEDGQHIERSDQDKEQLSEG